MVVLRHDTFSLAYTINPLSELSRVFRGSNGLITKCQLTKFGATKCFIKPL